MIDKSLKPTVLRKFLELNRSIDKTYLLLSILFLCIGMVFYHLKPSLLFLTSNFIFSSVIISLVFIIRGDRKHLYDFMSDKHTSKLLDRALKLGDRFCYSMVTIGILILNIGIWHS